MEFIPGVLGGNVASIFSFRNGDVFHISVIFRGGKSGSHMQTLVLLLSPEGKRCGCLDMLLRIPVKCSQQHPSFAFRRGTGAENFPFYAVLNEPAGNS